MNDSDKAVAGGPEHSSPRAPRVLLVYAPSEQEFADTLARDLHQHGIAVKRDSANTPNNALRRLTQAGTLPDWLVVILSPGALWSPIIAEEMRIATIMLGQKRILGALALVAVPYPHANVPPDWPITISFDATHDYPTALNQLSVALAVTDTPAQVPLTDASRDVSHEETTRLPSVSDLAQEETTRVPSVASTPDTSDTPELSDVPDISHEETAYLPSVTGVSDMSHEETVHLPSAPDPTREETMRLPSVADPWHEETVRLPSMGNPARGEMVRFPSLTRASAQYAPPAAPVDEADTSDATYTTDDAPARPDAPSSRVAPAHPKEPPHKPIISRRTLLGLGVAVAASALAGGSAYIWRMQQKPSGPLPGPEVRWRYLINSPVTTAAAEAKGVVYLGTEDGTFQALDATGHALRWMYKTGATIAPATPLAANGAIYFCTNDGTVYKLKDDPAVTSDAERLLWQFQQIGMRMLGPALSGNVLYVASKYRRIFALDSENGTVRWMTPATFSPTSPPTIADNRIYIAAANSACALDTNGTEIWRNPEVGAVNTDMVVANKLLYLGAQAGTVFALDIANGARRWKFATDDQIYIMPVVDTQRGAVYIGDMSGYFYAIDALSGTLRWRQKLDSPIFAPQVVSDSVYAVSTGGYLYALDPAVGAVRWQYVVGQGAVSPLGAGANTLYVDAADHYFYALAIP